MRTPSISPTGGFLLVDHEGNIIPFQAEAREDGDYIVPLWRVDAKPFGGTHGMTAFKGAEEAHREFDSQQGPAGPR